MNQLKLILKDKDVSIDKIKEYYGMNDEELAQLLTNFLTRELYSFNFYEHDGAPKYLFITKNKIEEIHARLYETGKVRAPFFNTYEKMKKELWMIEDYCNGMEAEQLTVPEKLYLSIFYYQDFARVHDDINTHKLSLLGSVEDKQLILHIMDAYFKTLSPEVDKEQFNYFDYMMKMIVGEVQKYPNLYHTMYDYYETNIEQLKEIKQNDVPNEYYRVQKALKLKQLIKAGINKDTKEVKIAFEKQLRRAKHEYIFTIDNDDTKLREDAMSINPNKDNIFVTVYITDVNEALMNNTTLEEKMKNNWFDGKTKLLTDYELEEKFTLTEGVKRKVMAYQMRFDKKLDLKQLTIAPTEIKVSKNYDYAAATKVLNQHGKLDKKVNLDLLYALAYKSNNAAKNEFHILKEIQRYTEKGIAYKPEDENFKNSKTIVSEFKILINRMNAEICKDNHIPAWYRANDFQASKEQLELIMEYKNDPSKEEELLELLHKTGVDSSFYSIEPREHKGQNLEVYGHYTTPCRNYPARINQAIFNDCILNHDYTKINDYQLLLKELDGKQNKKEKVENAARAIKVYKKRYLLNGIDIESPIRKIESLLDKGPLSIDDVSQQLNIALYSLEPIMDYLEDNLHVKKTSGIYTKLIGDKFSAGKMEIKPGGYGVVKLETGKNVLVPTRNLNGALTGDIVLIKEHVAAKGSIHRVVKRKESKRRITGVIICKDDRFYAEIDDPVYHDLIPVELLNGAQEDDKVIIEVVSKKNRNIGNVVKIFGNRYDPGVDIMTILHSHNVYEGFPQEVLDEAALIPDVVTDADKIGRLDLTNEEIFTIDGDDAKDLDDAVSLKMLPNGHYLLGVHIADVGYYVKEDSAIDKEARKRGTSVYVVDRVVPMLPETLSNGICSLNPGVERLTRSTFMEIDEMGVVVSYKIYNAVICSKKRMTYRKVNEVYEGNIPDGYEAYAPTLNQMLTLSKIERCMKKNRGSISFDTPKIKHYIDEAGRATGVYHEVRGEAERIIEDFMIVDNETNGKHMEDSGQPSPYRVHDKAELYKVSEAVSIAKLMGYDLDIDLNVEEISPGQIEHILDQCRDDVNFDLLSYLLLRAMPKAIYTTQNRGHFGLASECYSQATSPIRRYPDLVLNRAITMEQAGSFSLADSFRIENKYAAWMEHASEREQSAILCEREVDALKNAEYLQNHIGEEFSGRILSISKSGISVRLSNLIEGFISPKSIPDYHFDENVYAYINQNKEESLRLGDPISLLLTDSNTNTRTISFMVSGKAKEKVKTIINNM